MTGELPAAVALRLSGINAKQFEDYDLGAWRLMLGLPFLPSWVGGPVKIEIAGRRPPVLLDGRRRLLALVLGGWGDFSVPVEFKIG